MLSKVFRKGVYQKEFGAPYLSAHRADLVDVLRQQLPDNVIHLGARCTEVETSGNAARARFADGAEIEADLIVGADGIRSLCGKACSAGMPRDLPGRFAGADWFRSMRFRPA